MIALNDGDKIRGDAEAAAEVDYLIVSFIGEVPTNLADGQLPDAIGDLYTAGADGIGISSIILVNTGAAAQAVNLYLTPNGGTARRLIEKDYSLGVGKAIYTDGKVMKPEPATFAGHNFLDGDTHPDTAAQAVTRGSIVVGDATPEWNELPIGAATKYLRSDGTDPAYAAIPASEVVNTPAGGIGATDVQAALDELDDEKASDPHDLGGAQHGQDTLANLNAKVSDATLDTDTAKRPPSQGQFSITVEDPSDAEDICLGFTFVAITITEIQAVVVGSDTPSVTIDPSHSTDRSAAGNDILAAATAITNTTTGQNLTSFDDPTIPADSWIWLLTTAQSGTVDELTVTIKYTVD